jgi:kynurenine formamidase
MPRRFVDLSIYLENDVVSDPPPFGPKITYLDHRMSVPGMLEFFPGLKQEDLPDGEAWAVEKVELITHNGTHLDAPYHFASTMNDGDRAITIDEVALEWCFQPGVKLDFRRFPDGYVVSAADVAAELSRIGHALKPLEIVVVNTRAGSRYGHADYVDAGCGMGYEATMYLLERGVRLTGTDAWSWDARRSSIPRRNTGRRVMHRSSGRATRRAGISGIATWVRRRDAGIDRTQRNSATRQPHARDCPAGDIFLRFVTDRLRERDRQVGDEDFIASDHYQFRRARCLSRDRRLSRAMTEARSSTPRVALAAGAGVWQTM